VAISHEINQLPVELAIDEAVEAGYGPSLDWIEDKLRQRMSVLVECDMQLVTHLCVLLRRRLRAGGRGGVQRCRFITGAPDPNASGPQPGLMACMIRELGELVRSGEPGTVLVIPHLDLLTTTTRSGLSDNTREVIALVYENPEVTFLAFKDPSLELPKVIENVFTARRSILGIPRDRLPHIMLRREAKKFGTESFDPFLLYKYVSGLNVVRFRQIMEHIQDRLDYDPQNPAARKRLFHDIRELTLSGELEIPRVELEGDIGGYKKVKERIRKDILDLYESKESLVSQEEVKAIEELIPKGIIFEGPPGTGKTYFAKAIATALDATAIVVSGPELKSKWVGESEQNLRQIFTRARQSAPSIIIFDELDSFATRRGAYSGSGVEHSMVNQLLTEMDGFRKEELVFIIATTNLVESIDEALLRPGRFELTIPIGYPGEEDRSSILEVYRDKFKLDIPPDVLKHIVTKTGGYSNLERRTKFSGDHLYAICRALGRERIRKGPHPHTVGEVDAIIGETFAIRPPTEREQNTIAVHESGHALAAAILEHAEPPEKVSIEGIEDTMASGYVMREQRRGDHVITRRELRDELCVLLAGREAERIVIGDLSGGAQNDLFRASAIAREMVESLGMAEDLDPFSFLGPARRGSGEMQRLRCSEPLERRFDEAVEGLLREARERAHTLLIERRGMLDDMIQELLVSKVLEREQIQKFAARHGLTISWKSDKKPDWSRPDEPAQGSREGCR